MSCSPLDEICKNYIYVDYDRDTEEANKYYKEIINNLKEVLSIDLQNKIHSLISNYTIEVEERSFKDGLKYGINLYKELQ